MRAKTRKSCRWTKSRGSAWGLHYTARSSSAVCTISRRKGSDTVRLQCFEKDDEFSWKPGRVLADKKMKYSKERISHLKSKGCRALTRSTKR